MLSKNTILKTKEEKKLNATKKIEMNGRPWDFVADKDNEQEESEENNI